MNIRYFSIYQILLCKKIFLISIYGLLLTAATNKNWIFPFNLRVIFDPLMEEWRSNK